MSESALLRAVRDQIRTHNDFANRQVDVELDETVPPVAGDLYVIVFTGSQEPGPTHNGNQGASDILYGVNVSVAMRAPRKPRDRQRELFIATASSLQTYQNAIMSKVDFQYAVNSAANAYIATEESSSEGFIEALKFAGAGPIRRAPAELFSGTPAEPVAAVIRTMNFRGARRIVTRS